MPNLSAKVHDPDLLGDDSGWTDPAALQQQKQLVVNICCAVAAHDMTPTYFEAGKHPGCPDIL